MKILESIYDKVWHKRNCFIIQGPTNTGKSMTLNMLLKIAKPGLISREGDASAFYFQNLINKRIAILEEPRIMPQTVDNFKLLLGGERMEIQVKHKEPQMLPRTPIFITTNNNIGLHVSPPDAEALRSRCSTFHFQYAITHRCDNTSLASAEIEEPPRTLHAIDYYHVVCVDYYGLEETE